MAKQKDFDSFLSNIEPSATTVSYISSVHNNLRDYLANHSRYKTVHVQTFLSGSYAKHTCIRPKKNDDKRDVDIVVETSYNADTSSIDVLQELLDVLLEKSVYDSAELHAHSVGIEMEGIEIDVVPVIKSDNQEIYCIGTSNVNEWKLTDPKGHNKWSSEVNTDNNGKYKPLVKMIKWWRRTNCPENIKYPKGITLEKIIADNLPDSDLSTENYLIGAIQSIIDTYLDDYIDNGTMPTLDDPCLDDNDLLKGYKFTDFKAFIQHLSEHLEIIEQDGPTNDTWRRILGTEFPTDSTDARLFSNVAIQNALSVPHRQTPPWPIQKGKAVMINAQIDYRNGKKDYLENDGAAVPKECGLIYKAIHSVKQPYSVKWQIVNTGYEARDCLRGGFEKSDVGDNCKSESTLYSGKHYIQCFVVKNGRCVAKSKEFFINIE